MAINQLNIPVTLIDGGLNQSKPSVSIPPKFSPRCNNVIFKNGEVQKRTGLVWSYNTYAASDGPDKLPLGYAHFFDAKNNNRKFFQISQLSTNDLIVHPLDTANSHWDAKQTLTACAGSYDMMMNWCTFNTYDNTTGAWGKCVLLLNVTTTQPGIASDNACVWAYDTSVPSWAAVTGSPACKRVLSYSGRVLYIGVSTTLAGGLGNATSKIQVTDLGTYDDFLDGTSSIHLYLNDTQGAIQNAELLNDTVVVYKEDSIWTLTRITSNPYIRASCSYPDIGLIMPQMLVRYGQQHFFVGTNNIYRYAGGSDIEAIGDPIWTSFLSDIRAGGVSATKLYRNRGFASVHYDTGDVCFWIVTGTNAWPNKAYVYNIFQNTWTIWSLPTNLCVTGFGNYLHDSVITDGEFTPFYGAINNASADNTANLKTLKWDYTTFTDPTAAATSGSATTAINASWESKTFVGSLSETSTWESVCVEAKGLTSDAVTADPLTISMSTDDGYSWSDTQTISILDENFDSYSVSFNRNSYSVRYKFSDATISKGFSIRTFEVVPVTDERESE